MTDSEIITRCKQLCIDGKYDEAIKLTNKISDWTIATKAHLLCMEHEESTRRENSRRNGTEKTVIIKSKNAFSNGESIFNQNNK